MSPRAPGSFLPVRVFAAVVIPVLLAGSSGSSLAAGDRPNILFIFTDDHAPHAIGAYGSKINATPSIDRLASEGMLFRQSFCTNSLCGPSRAAILTGKHNHLNGFLTNRDTFDGSQVTFPKLLQAAGYQTAIVGKWHLRSAPTGFDYWEVLQGQGPYYNPAMRTAAGIREHTGYTTEIITDLALDWLENRRDAEKPFLLMCQHKAPHREWAPGPKELHLFDDITIPEPATLFDDWSGRTSATRTQTMTIAEHLTDADLKLVPPRGLTPEQLETWNRAYGPKNEAFRKAKLTGRDLVRWKYQRYIKDYLRTIAAVDEGIGRILEHLDRTGLAANTVVVYSSDQGFYLGDHGWFDKRWMYEESLKMPLIVRWPGVVRPGSADEHLVQNLDYAETFLEIAGVPVPAGMQGRSLVPLLKGEPPADWRSSIYYHFWENPGPHDVQRHYGVRTTRYKLIHYYEIGEWELFDLEKDPDELRSVHDEPAYAGVRRELAAELERLQKHYRDLEPHRSLEELRQKELHDSARQVELARVLYLPRRAANPRVNLDPKAKPLTAGAWCTPQGPDGVILAQGGEALGYSLYLRAGRPRFAVRNEGVLREVEGPAIRLGARVHLAGSLDAQGRLALWIDGTRVATAPGHLISEKPADGLSVGADTGSFVASYSSPLEFEGQLEDIRIYWGVLNDRTMRSWLGE